MESESGGACELLILEQERVAERFRRLDDAEGVRRRNAAGDDVLAAAEVVLDLEEHLLCPAVRRTLGAGRGTEQILASGRTARHVIAELRTLPAGERSAARFARLKEILARHFEVERGGLFPAVSGSPLDLERLGGEMLEFKARLDQARSRRLFAAFLS